MHAFSLLFKIQFLGLFGINKALHANRNKARQKLALAGLALVAIVFLVASYSAGAAWGLVQVGLVDTIPLLAIVVGAIAGVMTAFIKANGVLFGLKDYDLVMSLPVSLPSVVFSRISPLFFMNLIIGLLIMIPAFVVYIQARGAAGLSVAYMLLAAVLAPLIPLAIAILLAALVATFSSRFRHANIVMVMLSFVLILLTVAASFFLSFQSNSTAAVSAMSASLVDGLSAFFPPAAWAAEGIVEGNMGSFVLFAGTSLAAAVLLILALLRLFVPVNMLLIAGRPHGTFSFSEKDARVSKGKGTPSPFKALVFKEFRLVLATPIYLLNTTIGFALLVVGSLAAVVAFLSGQLNADVLPPSLAPYVGVSLPWTAAFFLAISSTTAPSVSLEGKSRWLMFSAPVSTVTLLGAKAALNLVMALPTILIATITLSFSFSLDAVSIVGMVVAPTAFALMATCLGLAIDVRHPRYDWTTPYEPVKRGVAVMVVTLAGVVGVGVGFLLTFTVGLLVSLVYALIIALVSIFLFRSTTRVSLMQNESD